MNEINRYTKISEYFRKIFGEQSFPLGGGGTMLAYAIVDLRGHELDTSGSGWDEWLAFVNKYGNESSVSIKGGAFLD
jgi:hypothetical protein